MGNNYFKVPQLGESELNTLDNLFKICKEELISNGKLSYDTRETLETTFDIRIHLGKSSHGWQFLWDHNHGLYYDLNLGSIMEFLKTPGRIIDEENNEYTPEEFLEHIQPKLHCHEGAHNMETYCAATPNDSHYYITPHTINIRGKNYNVTKYSEFEVHGLRFADTTEFR